MNYKKQAYKLNCGCYVEVWFEDKVWKWQDLPNIPICPIHPSLNHSSYMPTPPEEWPNKGRLLSKTEWAVLKMMNSGGLEEQ